jgi:hypothetical protein
MQRGVTLFFFSCWGALAKPHLHMLGIKKGPDDDEDDSRGWMSRETLETGEQDDDDEVLQMEMR